MKVVEINGYGAADVLRIANRPIPRPKKEEVLIKVIASGVNRPDIFQRQGLYNPPNGASDLLGLEVSGEIIDGDLSSGEFNIGDKVCALVNGGGYSEYCLAHISHCLIIPDSVSIEDAAGLPESLFTVWSNVFGIGHLSVGDSLLVHGGSSGIGVMAVQIAKALGYYVYATAGTDRKVIAVESLGAVKCINYKNEDFVDKILELTNMNGVNLVLDMVSGSYLQRNIKILSENGIISIIALLGGSRSFINCADILKKRLRISGSMLRSQSVAFKANLAKSLIKYVWPLIEKKLVKPVTYAYFPLDQVSSAHKMMESGEHIGKIILKI
ncbi:NADPH2:quinone reductase [Candidatus Kinetoplastibacterium desouzaii TCC079E]|uniref:NADPH2:quinone reductase n=1 Tax=Candidatus Kinetoplastidibacterium desouzai TCC079E TaxID=1208919 RepID=M1LSE8_9PROT|nr:NAD(P)H-quinone oxidoreductase [Candidatus Kinetoplastibacterium desouzaii]AGF47056.1 NADPH2:quinone reductase [Candidatus Kinetoplastibacterium desouzaii TCC079E]